MGSYFLDTSAVIKRYVHEIGSEWVESVCQPSAEHIIIISQATLVEAVASFCRKGREQQLSQRISETERDQIIKTFRRDAQKQYNTVRVTSTIYTQAGELCRGHRLRAYDAIQLACALQIRTTLAALGVVPIFVSADIGLLNIAQDEGLSIENPNTYLYERKRDKSTLARRTLTWQTKNSLTSFNGVEVWNEWREQPFTTTNLPDLSGANSWDLYSST